jgi:hypothetical protein
MSTSRPFSYNTGSDIAGTTQVGSLAVGTLSAVQILQNYNALKSGYGL